MRTLILYSRRGCPLCDEMMLDLDIALRGRDVTFEVVDIDTDPELAARFADRIPVLVDNEEEISAGHLDVSRLPQ